VSSSPTRSNALVSDDAAKIVIVPLGGVADAELVDG
jgi:hypothetical protein